LTNKLHEWTEIFFHEGEMLQVLLVSTWQNKNDLKVISYDKKIAWWFCCQTIHLNKYTLPALGCAGGTAVETRSFLLKNSAALPTGFASKQSLMIHCVNHVHL